MLCTIGAVIQIFKNTRVKLWFGSFSASNDADITFSFKILVRNHTSDDHYCSTFLYVFPWMECFCILIAWQCISIGLVNGLASNRRQAIIWTNADPIHWRKYAALEGDELTHRGHIATLIWVDVGLAAQGHYLNKCWLIISDGHCRSFQGNLKNYSSKISLKSHRGQWVDILWHEIEIERRIEND